MREFSKPRKIKDDYKNLDYEESAEEYMAAPRPKGLDVPSWADEYQLGIGGNDWVKYRRELKSYDLTISQHDEISIGLDNIALDRSLVSIEIENKGLGASPRHLFSLNGRSGSKDLGMLIKGLIEVKKLLEKEEQRLDQIDARPGAQGLDQ